MTVCHCPIFILSGELILLKSCDIPQFVKESDEIIVGDIDVFFQSIGAEQEHWDHLCYKAKAYDIWRMSTLCDIGSENNEHFFDDAHHEPDFQS